MFIRFLIVGALGFLIDLGATTALITGGLNPFAARAPSICLAMAFTWLAHRRFTFRVQAPRTGSEAVRFTAVSVAMSVVNFAIYSGLVYAQWHPSAAIFVATAVQACLSFFGHRALSFRLKSNPDDGGGSGSGLK